MKIDKIFMHKQVPTFDNNREANSRGVSTHLGKANFSDSVSFSARLPVNLNKKVISLSEAVDKKMSGIFTFKNSEFEFSVQLKKGLRVLLRTNTPDLSEYINLYSRSKVAPESIKIVRSEKSPEKLEVVLYGTNSKILEKVKFNNQGEPSKEFSLNVYSHDNKLLNNVYIRQNEETILSYKPDGKLFSKSTKVGDEQIDIFYVGAEKDEARLYYKDNKLTLTENVYYYDDGNKAQSISKYPSGEIVTLKYGYGEELIEESFQLVEYLSRTFYKNDVVNNKFYIIEDKVYPQGISIRQISIDGGLDSVESSFNGCKILEKITNNKAKYIEFDYNGIKKAIFYTDDAQPSHGYYVSNNEVAQFDVNPDDSVTELFQVQPPDGLTESELKRWNERVDFVDNLIYHVNQNKPLPDEYKSPFNRLILKRVNQYRSKREVAEGFNPFKVSIEKPMDIIASPNLFYLFN